MLVMSRAISRTANEADGCRVRQPPLRSHPNERADYFRSVTMVLNVAFSLEPSAVAPPIIATAMRTAIRPYSMAVAPDSSRTKRAIRFDMKASTCLTPVYESAGFEDGPSLDIAESLYADRLTRP